MGARTVDELVCYRLAVEFRSACIAITARDQFKADRRFCDDLRAAARSVAANIAEGFCRRTHREFARFLEISLSSIAETEHHLQEARVLGYISALEEAECRKLARRTTIATSRLRRYLTGR
jgi:four helix bundle protein